VLELTCQDCDVEMVPVNDLYVLRVSDVLVGVAINIPMTALSLLALVGETAQLAA
jgi:hypothetical protein